MKATALLLFLGLTSGCYQFSSAVTAARLSGQPVSDYIKRHGPPDRTMDLPDGTTVATWYWMGQAGSHQSTVTFDQDGIITDFNHR